MKNKEIKFIDNYYSLYNSLLISNLSEIKKKLILIKKNNPVMKKGDINLWINSKAYNFIENIHQFWLLLLVDLLIGKIEYKAKVNER